MTDIRGALMVSEKVANAVANAVSDGRRIVDTIEYIKDTDSVLFFCGQFGITIERSSIPELRDIPQTAMETVTLSASGSTLIIESDNIYIEAAGIIAGAIENLHVSKHGNLILDLLGH